MYGLTPRQTERISRKVTRVYTDHGDFAMKQSRFTRSDLFNWDKITQWLETQGRNLAPPVIKTKKNHPYHIQRDYVYYLTPWVEHTKDKYPSHDIESFYHSIGMLHKQTKKQVRSAGSFVTALRERNEASTDIHGRLLDKLEFFEKQHYMSPLGLSVCSQYRQVHDALELLKDLSGELPEKGDEIPIVVNHGNLKNSHIIQYHGHSYFLNWERMYIGPATVDLSRFFLNDFRYHDTPIQDYMKKFYIYEQLYGMSNQERVILAIQLVDPHHYWDKLEKVVSSRSLSELEKVWAMEKSFRRVIFGRVAAEALYSSYQAQQLQEEGDAKSTPDETQ
nr:phosphotransferase [Thalassobacillus pellis]